MMDLKTHRKRNACALPPQVVQRINEAVGRNSMQMRLVRSEVIELRGADALAFAHAQLMNDVRVLSDGQWQWSGWLTPKGRLVAFFAVVRVDAQTLLLWLPAGGAVALADRLKRFVFRSKVSIDPAGDWVPYGTFENPSMAGATSENDPADGRGDAPAPSTDREASTVILAFPSDADSGPRWLVIRRHAPGDMAPHLAAGGSGDFVRWLHADLALGVPYIAADSANSEQFVPQWLSLERLDAFNLRKGCYPGQEIVARMHFLGQSKRSAFRLKGVGSPPRVLARALSAQGDVIGEIVWALADEADAWQALSVLTSDRASNLSSVDGAGTASLAG
jgi:folate-binding protein YgfZ